MNYEDWAPLYDEILDYFQFDREADAAAADLLAGLLPRDDLPVLDRLIRDREVTVCGNAPTLVAESGGSAGSCSPRTAPPTCSTPVASGPARSSPTSTARPTRSPT